MANPPGRLSQDLEPFTSCPNIRTAARRIAERMYRGQASLRRMREFISSRVRMPAVTDMPIHISWLPLLEAREKMLPASSL